MTKKGGYLWTWAPWEFPYDVVQPHLFWIHRIVDAPGSIVAVPHINVLATICFGGGIDLIDTEGPAVLRTGCRERVVSTVLRQNTPIVHSEANNKVGPLRTNTRRLKVQDILRSGQHQLQETGSFTRHWRRTGTDGRSCFLLSPANRTKLLR